MRPSRRRAALSTCSSVSTDTRTSRPPHLLLAQDAEPHPKLDLDLAHHTRLTRDSQRKPSTTRGRELVARRRGSYTSLMRQGWLLLGLLASLLLGGCSVLSIDLQPRIRPLEEDTVEGKGMAKILLLDLSGVF